MMSDFDVFYVDDDKDDLNIFREVLKSLGHTAHLFNDGYELLINLEDADPERIILFIDLNMPKIGGHELIRAIRKSAKYAKIPIIVFSTSKEIPIVSLSREAGANLHVQKSNSFASLKKSIRHVLSIDWNSYNPDKQDFVYSIH